MFTNKYSHFAFIRVTAYEKCLTFLGMFSSPNNHNGQKIAGSESLIGKSGIFCISLLCDDLNIKEI